MTHYLRKQATIFIVFLAIIVVIAGGIYLLLHHENATCYDGIQNQSETGIDCGGPCGPCPIPKEKLEILSQDFIPTTENNFDLVAKVQNPNSNWGIDSIVYKFNFYDADNNLIDSKQGTAYFLPQETKYIVEQKFSLSETPASVKFELGSPHWQYLRYFEELRLRITNTGYELIDGKYHLSGIIENKSNYNLNQVEVIGVLFDENKKPIAAGKTTMETLMINEARGFEIIWPYTIDKTISSFDVRAHTNVYLDENFIRVNSSPVPQ